MVNGSHFPKYYSKPGNQYNLHRNGNGRKRVHCIGQPNGNGQSITDSDGERNREPDLLWQQFDLIDDTCL
jgi:hypothetical protein